MYPTDITPAIIETTPLGNNFPEFFARTPINPDNAMQVPRDRRVPILYVGCPMRDAEINSRTATPVDTRRLVVLDFLAYASIPETRTAKANRYVNPFMGSPLPPCPPGPPPPCPPLPPPVPLPPPPGDPYSGCMHNEFIFM